MPEETLLMEEETQAESVEVAGTDLEAGEQISETEESSELEESTEESVSDGIEETSPVDSLESETDPSQELPMASLALPDVLQVENLTVQVMDGATVDGLFPEEEETEVFVDVPSVYAFGNALSLVIPANHVVYEMAGKQLVFPSDYVDDLLLVDGYLVNMGAPVTISVNLSDSASVSNYIISQVTFPTYGSSDYISYVTSYGSPYRIVDRYRNYNGNIVSSTRSNSSAMMQEIVQPHWYGFSGGRMYGYLFAVAVIFLLIWGRLRWKH